MNSASHTKTGVGFNKSSLSYF